MSNSSDVFDEIISRLKEKTKTDIQIYGQSTFSNEQWVKLEDVKSAIQQLKQKICNVFDQYIKAYPLDTPEDRQVSKVLNQIREELLKDVK